MFFKRYGHQSNVGFLLVCYFKDFFWFMIKSLSIRFLMKSNSNVLIWTDFFSLFYLLGKYKFSGTFMFWIRISLIYNFLKLKLIFFVIPCSFKGPFKRFDWGRVDHFALSHCGELSNTLSNILMIKKDNCVFVLLLPQISTIFWYKIYV